MSTAEAIEHQVQAILDRHGVTVPPVNIEAIAVAEHIQVVRSASVGPEVGFLLTEDGRTIIGVNSRRSVRRQRRAIAHSLGHRVLHGRRHLTVDHDIRIARATPSTATMPEEAEANLFAAALLAPANLVAVAVRREIALGYGVKTTLIQRLAAEFDISTESMGSRLTILGWLT